MAEASLFYEARGAAERPAIVFLHGGGASGWMWQAVIEHLPQYRCYAVDLPEQGQSPVEPPFAMETAADAVAQLVTELGLSGRVHIVGLSEGAQVLTALLARHPHLAESALISSALLLPMRGMGWMTPTVMRWTYRTAVAPFRRWEAWIRLNMKYSAGIPAQYFPQFKRDFQSLRERGFVNLMMANQGFRLPQGLERVDGRVLIVVGRHEYAAMRQSARDLAAALPRAVAKQIDLGRGALAKEHNWALTEPERFAQTVAAWVAGDKVPAFLQDLHP